MLGASPWRSASAQVIVESLDVPVLSPDDLHHLMRVLRLRPGSEVCATDGRGGWRSTSFVGGAELTPMGEVHHEPAPQRPVTVGFALVKGEKPELVVQKLTELGVDRIVPFAADRSVVRWDAERAAKNMDRLRRVAREACGQCRRLRLPEIGLASASVGGSGAVSSTLATVTDLRGVGAVLANAGGRPLGTSDSVVIIGPEGGWSEAEHDGSESVSLGENVLRAETAAITAGALMVAMRIGLVREALESSP